MNRKKIAIVACILAMLCIAGNAWAATDLPSSPELPTTIKITKDNDVSASFLSNLIGPSWKDIAGGAAADDLGGMGRYHGLLLGFLGMLNLAAMAFVSAAIMYHWGVFAVTTAHEGKSIGGSVYNSLWVPVRHAFSFGLTVPVLNGLSLLQVAILACVSLSINFANSAWDWAGEYIVQNSQSGIIDNSPPLIEDESLTLIQPLFQAVTISELLTYYARPDDARPPHVNHNIKNQPLPETVDIYAIQEFKSVELVGERYVIVREPLEGAITVYVMPGASMALGQLGKVTINAPVRKFANGALQPLSEVGVAMEQIAEARVQAVIKTADALRIDARRYLQLQQVIAQDKGPYPLKSGLEIAREYRRYITDATALQVERIKASNDTKGLLEKALDSRDGKSQLGWVSAGLFSSALAQRQRQIDELVYGGSARFEFPDTDFPDQGFIGDMKRFFGSEDTAYVFGTFEKSVLNGAPRWAANEIMGGRVYASRDENGDGPGLINRFLAATFIGGTGADGLVATTLSNLRRHDPIVVLSDFGDKAWTSATYLAVGSAIASLGGISSGAVTTGMLALFAVAITLKIIAPLTIVSIWLYAVLHWIVRVIEALVAGPFWAAMHMMPQGHGFAGDAARKGYTLLLDILMRPFLLVFGACVSIAVWLGGSAVFSILFSAWLNSYTGYNGAGLVTEIILVSAILIFFFYQFTKLFVLMISQLPDRINNWIGGVNGGMGSEEASGTAPLLASGAAAAKGGAMLGSVIGGTAGTTNSLYDKLRKKKDDDKPKADLSAGITPKE